MKIETIQVVRLSKEEYQILDKASKIIDDIADNLVDSALKSQYVILFESLAGAIESAEVEEE